MKKLSLAIAASTAALALIAGTTTTAEAYATYDLSGKRAALLDAHNNKRAAKCGRNLQASSGLGNAAQYHAGDMADEDYFTHDSQNPSEGWVQRISRFTGYQVGGENIASNQSSVSEVMSGWMASPGHKQNIMDCSFTRVGFGYAYVLSNAEYKRLWVADFAY